MSSERSFEAFEALTAAQLRHGCGHISCDFDSGEDPHAASEYIDTFRHFLKAEAKRREALELASEAERLSKELSPEAMRLWVDLDNARHHSMECLRMWGREEAGMEELCWAVRADVEQLANSDWSSTEELQASYLSAARELDKQGLIGSGELDEEGCGVISIRPKLSRVLRKHRRSLRRKKKE